jgi:hypothetical protein
MIFGFKAVKNLGRGLIEKPNLSQSTGVGRSEHRLTNSITEVIGRKWGDR